MRRLDEGREFRLDAELMERFAEALVELVGILDRVRSYNFV